MKGHATLAVQAKQEELQGLCRAAVLAAEQQRFLQFEPNGRNYETCTSGFCSLQSSNKVSMN